MKKQHTKQKILIADDSEMNRAILSDMLRKEFDILEAENGVEAITAIQKHEVEISVVLLDIVMPKLDGFGVLEVMNKRHWIENIPVIMITSESGPSHVERAYELGIKDFINRPFDAMVVYHRVVNTILLYTKQNRLMNIVAEQMLEKEQQSTLMVDVLSHIVEFRNGESGLHVIHIRVLTNLLLKQLVRKTNRYELSNADISLISTAAALHDIGKIVIPKEILNKPGKLSAEEFAVMKTHTVAGANMIEQLSVHQGEALVKWAYQICRWHHERYDGRGYPDGLSGDDIPVAAQIVALADVYDALTSKRVYKAAYSHETAVEMILDGQCGVFNPLLLECLTETADIIREELQCNVSERVNSQTMRDIAEDIFQHEKLTASDRTLELLEHERMKYRFFAEMSQEIQFEYTLLPPLVVLSAWGAEKLELPESIIDPHHDEKVAARMEPEAMLEFSDMLRSTSPEHPVVKYNCLMHLQGEARWTQLIARAIWSADDPPRYTGAIGKAVDVHDTFTKMSHLEQLASHDNLVGLFNYRYAKERIEERLKEHDQSKFALVILDLDHFKAANDTYGHLFGNRVLLHMAEKLRGCIRSGDIAARVGGDEFLIALEYKGDIRMGIKRIFSSLIGQFEDFTISVSMGVAETDLVGREFDTLFHAADQALYAAKRAGRGQYCFYDTSMKAMLSEISPIDE